MLTKPTFPVGCCLLLSVLCHICKWHLETSQVVWHILLHFQVVLAVFLKTPAGKQLDFRAQLAKAIKTKKGAENEEQLSFTKVWNKTNVHNMRSLILVQYAFIRRAQTQLRHVSHSAHEILCVLPCSRSLHLQPCTTATFTPSDPQAPKARGAWCVICCCTARSWGPWSNATEEIGAVALRKPVCRKPLLESIPLLPVSCGTYMIYVTLVIILCMHDEYFISIFIIVWRATFLFIFQNNLF